MTTKIKYVQKTYKRASKHILRGVNEMMEFEVKIIEQNNSVYGLVFSTSFISPLKFLTEIEEELGSKVHERIEVVFDFLLSSGNTNERFAKVIFDGKSFDKSSFQFIKLEKKNTIRDLAADFYKTSIGHVDNSILTSVQKKLVHKGLYI